MKNKKDIKDLTLDELSRRLAPPYRARQVFRWLYGQGAEDFSLMTNLPPELRTGLSGSFYIRGTVPAAVTRSRDGSEKHIFRLADGPAVESVAIPSDKRMTICVSTQAGCRFRCTFCASGFRGFTRNLSAGEMLDQVLGLRKARGEVITNIVFMGMGEPLDNYPNLVRALEIITEPSGMNISARRITVSTCGIAPGIEKLAGLNIPVKLAVSIHAPFDELRSRIMPVNRKYPLGELLGACETFARRGRRLTLEYLLIRGLNDSPREASGLAKIAGRLGAVVNLIPFNPVPGKPFLPSGEEKTGEFMRFLCAKKVNVTLRRSRGADINAACGQLAGEAPR